MKMVYVAHPFLGEKSNVQLVEDIICDLVLENPEITFYSPLHSLGFLYDIVSYNKGMKHCFEALKRCDELWLCKGWRTSLGCKIEFAYATENKIPIVEL